MPTFVYAGSGFFGVVPGSKETKENDGEIHSFELTTTLKEPPPREPGDRRPPVLTPTFAPLEVIKQGGSFPMWLAADEAQRFLYAVDSPTGEEPGLVHAYAVTDDGKLTELNSVSSEGSVPCHLSVVGKTVLVANYSGGNVAALPIAADGSLGAATSVHVHGPGAKGGHASGRMDAAHPHIILPAPDKKFVFVCDLGCNKIFSYALDAEASKLTPVSEVELPAGSGPRHLAFSPTGATPAIPSPLCQALPC